MKINTFFYLGILAFMMPFFVVAQEAENDISEEIVELDEYGWGVVDEVDGGQVNCFDYYTFQSVQVALDLDKNHYNQGGALLFSGDIINSNDHPVVDGNIFVRIARKNNNEVITGADIIDEFVAVENISVQSHNEVPVEFEWQMPSNIKAGQYRADFFFSVGKKFNLGGLPFSNEIIVGTAEFGISSVNNDGLFFDRDSSQINGEKYNHIGNSEIFEKGSSVEIMQPLKNLYLQDREIEITYEVYYWDSLFEKDKISETSEKITIVGKAQQDIRFTVSDLAESVYYVKITAKSDEEKSIVNYRFVTDINKPRLNYPAITKFPLKKGDEYTVFSCFHNTINDVVIGDVVVQLLDRSGKEIGRTSYSGNISSGMMAMKEDLVAAEKIEYIKLLATVTDELGIVADQYEVEYDCESLGICAKKTAVNSDKEMAPFDFAKKGLFTIFLLVPIFVIGGIVIYKKYKC